MSTYKVIQDIEAEDKLVGPLSLRQFVYGGAAAVSGYLAFFLLSNGLGLVDILILPITLFTGFFAFPWGRDQPTEVWALAKIRFFLKSRRRIWNQSGVKDLVDITAPKRIERNYSRLSEHEVKSRLTALASTLDTRGWAIKNVNTNLYAPEQVVAPVSDRLIDGSALPQEVATIEVTAADDMLDEENNPRAHQLQEMVAASTTNHRQQLIEHMKQSFTPPTTLPAPAAVRPQQQAPQDYWFLSKPIDMPQPAAGKAVFSDAPVVHAGDDDEDALSPEEIAAEKVLAERLRKQHEKSEAAASNPHLKTIQPLHTQAAQHKAAPPSDPIATEPAKITNTPVPKPQPTPVTPLPDPATINLASNNDLNIATIARIANRQDKDSGEVVISLRNR